MGMSISGTGGLISYKKPSKNILIDFLGKNVFGPELFYATSDFGTF